MYRRRFQRRVTSRCRRGPTVCWRNTSVSGVPRIDLRTGSCNHPRSSSPPSQFNFKFISRASFFYTFLFFSLSCFLSHFNITSCLFLILLAFCANIAQLFFLFFSSPFPAISPRFSFCYNRYPRY